MAPMLSRLPMLILLLMLSACTPTAEPPASEFPVAILEISELTGEDWEQNSEAPFFPLALTMHNPDGNRYIPGSIDLANAEHIDIALEGMPQWILGMGLGPDQSIWLAVLEDGQVQTFLIKSGKVSQVSGLFENLAAGQPPAMAWVEGELVLINSLEEIANPNNHPVFVGSQIASMDSQGRLSLDNEIYAKGFLPDGRILFDESGRILLLNNPSSAYQHGIMGDAIEAQGLSLLDSVNDFGNAIGVLNGARVYEAIAPIWADLDQDGQREILVTASDANVGAQLMLYSEDGELLAISSAIGQGYRWRNQMAIAPFGPNGEWEIADVLTPHIGGVVEFFSWQANELRVVAQLPGYTSHVIGSRNLDLGLAADVNADGRVELLLPTQRLDHLAAIQRSESGAKLLWELSLPGSLSSNIASARFANGTLAIGVGLDAEILRVWLP